MKKTVSIIVSGKVQGVSFRQGAKEKAIQLRISGRVRNLPDGTVYIIATGTDEQLQELITWCYTGPPEARVIAVTVTAAPYKDFDAFSIYRH